MRSATVAYAIERRADASRPAPLIIIHSPAERRPDWRDPRTRTDGSLVALRRRLSPTLPLSRHRGGCCDPAVTLLCKQPPARRVAEQRSARLNPTNDWLISQI